MEEERNEEQNVPEPPAPPKEGSPAVQEPEPSAAQPPAFPRHQQPTAVEILASASWLLDIQDVSEDADRVHEIFQSVIFDGAPPLPEDAPEEGERKKHKKRFRTAADEKRQAELRNELKDLIGEKLSDSDEAEGEEEPDSDILDFDKISEQEEMEEGMHELEQDPEFRMWLGAEAQELEAEKAVSRETNEQALQFELSKVGLGKRDMEILQDRLPERIAEIDLEYEVPDTGLSKEKEAIWMLRQLIKPGQCFASNEEVHPLLTEPDPVIERHALVKALVEVIAIMTVRKLEPSHVMLYHQSIAAELLNALWTPSTLYRYYERLVNPSFAYSEETGVRQKPVFRKDENGKLYGGFHRLPIDPTTDVPDVPIESGNFPNVRKPCVIELGRLLQRIQELHFQVLRLENSRLRLVQKFEPLELMELDRELHYLRDVIIFRSAFESFAWEQYVNHLVRLYQEDQVDRQRFASHVPSPTAFLRTAGLRDELDRFALKGELYQNNFIEGNMTEACYWPKEGTPENDVVIWLYGQLREKGIHEQLAPQMQMDRIRELFVSAAVEQLSVQPQVRLRIFETFRDEGVCYVIPTSLSRQTSQEVIHISSFLDGRGVEYLELLGQEEAGLCRLELHIEDDRLKELLDFDRYFFGAAKYKSPSWSEWRSTILPRLIQQLRKVITIKLHEYLRMEAEQHLSERATEALGVMCAEGPYQMTELKLIAAQQNNQNTWEAGWNVVESLPVQERYPRFPPGHARVCGAYCGASGVTVIAFIDGSGTVLGTARWSQHPAGIRLDQENTDERKQILDDQKKELARLCALHAPHVLAVGAYGKPSTTLFKYLKVISPELIGPDRVPIPVIWAPCVIAQTFSWSAIADEQVPNTDVGFRAALSLARYVRNPIIEICNLFNHKNDILKVPLGVNIEATVFDKNRYLRRLEREMSLWIAACGLDINRIMQEANPTSVLQFVPGLGKRRAARLANEILQQGGLLADRSSMAYYLASHGKEVIENALPCIRISLDFRAKKVKPGSKELDPAMPEEASEIVREALRIKHRYATEAMESDYHPLDVTLIPPEWYHIAENICNQALKKGDDSTRGPWSCAEFFLANEKERFNKLKDLTYNVFVQYIDSTQPASRPVNEREFEFIIDELHYGGRSVMTRPFRLISSRRLMTLITGVSWCARGEPYNPRDSAVVVRQGETVSGVIIGYSVRKPSGTAQMRLRTTNGMIATVPEHNFGDTTASKVHEIAVEYEKFMERKREVKSDDETEVEEFIVDTPELALKASFRGVAVDCNFNYMELILSRLEDGGGEDRDITTFEPTHMQDAALADIETIESASHASIRTAQLEKTAAVFVTKASRHVLFRNVKREKIERLLENATIGETLLRPSASSVQKFIVSVKTGDTTITHIEASEKSRTTGSICYTLTDAKLGEKFEFDEIDALISQYVKPMIDVVNNLRRHRRFAPTYDNVDEVMLSQIPPDVPPQTPLFAYAFYEATGDEAQRPEGSGEKNGYRFIHRNIRNGQSIKERTYKLHIDHQGIHCKATTTSREYLHFHNPDELVAHMKKTALKKLKDAHGARPLETIGAPVKRLLDRL